MNKFKILITSYPFCDKDKTPFKLLNDSGFIIDKSVMNLKRKLTKEELLERIKDVDAVIAGTEKYNAEILEEAKKLKLISRLGIGLDSIDFAETKKRKIAVAYTPDAPSRAVAELTLGLMINAARRVLTVDNDMRNGKWNRFVGADISNKIIGIIGLGRIGKLMVKFLRPFDCRIFVNDIAPDYDFIKENELVLCPKNKIYRLSDVITLHIPLTKKTQNMITSKQLEIMKKNAVLINASRGGIINEEDLFFHLTNTLDFYTAIDAFEKEPYSGKLCSLKNIILTPHLGSCSEHSRYLMETGAVKNVIDFFCEIETNPNILFS
ncbi:MAG TPA: phosphoglycerate dehydrogenase [bacterium]|nr:phosphoglycerate dehydrogenase [bacterium]HPN31640.1 phosphoglycerate dehydrogenase [bacterium]